MLTEPLIRRKFYLFFLCFLISIGNIFSSPFQNISIEEAKRQAKKENKLIFAHYYAEWCLSCKQMEKSIYSDQAVVKALEKNFIAVKVQVDSTAHISWKENYGVYVLPTILFTFNNGKEIQRKQKQISKSKFMAILDEVVLQKPLPRTQNSVAQNKIISRAPTRYPLTKPMPAGSALNKKTVVSKPLNADVNLMVDKPHGTIFAEEIPDNMFVIQVAAYFKHNQAQRLVDELMSLQYEECQIVIENTNDRTMYKVILGKYNSIKTARLHLLDIQDSGYEAYIKHI